MELINIWEDNLVEIVMKYFGLNNVSLFIQACKDDESFKWPIECCRNVAIVGLGQ